MLSADIYSTQHLQVSHLTAGNLVQEFSTAVKSERLKLECVYSYMWHMVGLVSSYCMTYTFRSTFSLRSLEVLTWMQ